MPAECFKSSCFRLQVLRILNYKTCMDFVCFSFTTANEKWKGSSWTCLGFSFLTTATGIVFVLMLLNVFLLVNSTRTFFFDLSWIIAFIHVISCQSGLQVYTAQILNQSPLSLYWVMTRSYFTLFIEVAICLLALAATDGINKTYFTKRPETVYISIYCRDNFPLSPATHSCCWIRALCHLKELPCYVHPTASYWSCLTWRKQRLVVVP